MTRIAGFVAANFDLLFRAEERIVEFEIKVFAEVGATLRATALAAPAAEEIAKAEKLSEYVAEVLEDGGIETCRGAGGAPYSCVPETIVERALLDIGKNRIGFRQFLELIFRIRIIRVAVRMVRHRELAVSALDLDVSGRAGDAEDLVIVSFAVVGQKRGRSLRKVSG
jgi:hypothetical protein